jgi:tripartite-type tricarboxylate transporter receptor subunit TctC
MKKTRMLKTLMPAIMALALGVPAESALAQSTYPTKPITLVVPVPPGGPADAIFRPIVEKLSEVLGQSVIILNKPGAEGTTGTAYLAKAKADGYTLGMGHTASLAIIPAEREVGYDPLKDFTPITRIVTGPLVMLVRKDFPGKTLAEFVKYAKDNPGKVTYSSAGGGIGQLIGVSLESSAGIKMIYVPYTGAAPAITDMLGGRIDATFAGLSGGLPYVENGSLRAIAVTERSALLPDVPPISDTYPEAISGGSSYTLVGPAGMPPDVVHRLYEEVNRIVRSPEFVKRMNAAGQNVVSSTPEEYAEFMKTDAVKWADVVKAAGLAKVTGGKN